MLNNCTIWIGLPAFNEEKAIKKVLKSIISLKKKINKIRVIIVNDGSKDKTLLNAKKFQKKLNIKIINIDAKYLIKLSPFLPFLIKFLLPIAISSFLFISTL